MNRILGSMNKQLTLLQYRGATVYRGYGGNAEANGRYWATRDPRAVPNYRSKAGLPDKNSGRFLAKGTLRDTTGVEEGVATSLDGNPGGEVELKIPNPDMQIDIEEPMIFLDPPL
jgi:hypothetical protein